MFILGFFIRGGGAYTDLYGAMGSYVLRNQTIKQFQGGKPDSMGQMPRPLDRNN